MSGSRDIAGAWRLRGYVVERHLGSGSSGDVWLGRIRATGEAVALKRLAVPSADLARRASAEAAKLTVLDHPHLVRLHAYVPDDQVAVLVLDLADAGSLAELLDVRGRVTPGELITAVAPVAAALAYIHGAGVIHGDVSAANVLFTRAGLPLLADLGVSRLFGDLDDVASTPAYVDPLVARGGVPGPHSDVFMLGAVALHALTGTPLWSSPDSDAALTEACDENSCAARLARVPALLAEADAPLAMAAVIRRALDLDPARRGSAAELALDLRHSGQPVAVELAAGLERHAPVLPGPGIDVPPAPTETRPRGGRHAAPPVRSGRPARTTWSPGRSRTAQRSQAAAARVSAARVSAAGVRPSTDPPSADPARPAFERPPSVGRPPPTNAIARPRPTVPPARRRSRLLATRSLAVAGGAAIVLAAAALGGALWMHAGRPAPALAAPLAPAASGPPPSPSRPSPSRFSPSRPSPSRPSPTSAARGRAPARARWSATLRQLDARRARAFATRNPQLLRQVYVAGPLLDADSAQLRRIVPTGCGLLGAHTSFEPGRVHVNGRSVVIVTMATLAPSRLVCGGGPGRSAAALGPTRLRITLVRSAPGMRIAEERVLS